MVKEEDWTDSDSSSDIEILDQKPAPVASSDVEPFSSAKSADERSFPTSSSDHVKSYFVGMGFAPTLVDKVFRQNVEADTELLLEALIRESSSGLEASTSVKEEIESPLDFELDDELDTKHPSTPFQDADKRLYLLLMEFSEEEVDRAINQLGESAPLQELVDFIITAQTEGVSEVNDRKGSESDLKKDEEHTSEALFGVMEKTLHLLQMGFTEEEVSTAIDNFGPDLSIGKLADSIFMSRLSQRVKKEEDQTAGASEIKTEPESPDCSDHALEGLKSCSSVPGRREANASSSKSEYYDYEENVRVKKAKCTLVNDESSFWCGATQQAKREAVQQSKPYHCSQFKETSELTFVKEEMPEKMIPNPKGSIRGSFYRSPYFFYGNVVEVSPGTWRKLSGFLYSTEPEFINCQFFSALMRKEGYIHNLPKGTRFNILPRPPMTLQEALPHAKKWWPLWDTRKHLSCINDENRVAPQICEKLEQMLVSSRGTLAEEQKSFILQQCKTFNLIWMGQNKLSLVEPEQLEFILGYPRHHTQILGLEGDERFRALKYSFQIDTLGYCLSTLKAQYPDGLRVLSIYSGIGGAEIALHRLGIRLKCVVSVEGSEASRKIIKRWWQSTGQSGELIQIAGIHKLTMQTLINFIQQFGGFDLVIGGNPCTCIDGSSSVVSSQMGMDQGLFMEFVRVLQRVKSIMGINW